MQKTQDTITVTQLNRQIRSFLENEVGPVAVIGEISNLAKPGSGHFYFTLKDAAAQIRCVFFRSNHDIKSTGFKDGQQVIATGRLSLYEARGDYQLIVQTLSEAGLGELYRQFELLKAKLQAQGLFDVSTKREIPPFPNTIAVVTSSSGAALRDILTCLKRRYPLAEVLIYPSEVQGKGAATQLLKAIQKANEDGRAEVLILARGGGSIEDLWAFNDEQLAITIRNSAIPIVSGIGHETDFTIADFVADLRAATPTAAAEAVTPNQADLLFTLHSYETRIASAITRYTQHKQLLLSYQIAKFLSPAQLISKYWQAIDNLEQKLSNSMFVFLYERQGLLHQLTNTLQQKNPITILQQSKAKIEKLEQLLMQNMRRRLNATQQNFSATMATLHAISPLATLDRGYAIATHKKSILFDSSQVDLGASIQVRLAKGNLICSVLEKDN